MSWCHTSLLLPIIHFASLCHTHYYLCLLPFPLSNFGYFPPRYGAPGSCGWRNGLKILRVAETILIKQPRTTDRGWSSSFVDGRSVTQPLTLEI